MKISYADLPLVLSGFRHRSKCRLICRCDITTLHTGHGTTRIHYSIKYITTANMIEDHLYNSESKSESEVAFDGLIDHPIYCLH